MYLIYAILLFPGTFNASGFHEEILQMKPGGKGYGIDNCIRHLDFRNPDQYHKSFFLMGIYAERIARERDTKGNFTDPSKHKQFFNFQIKIVDQFFEFISSVGVRIEEVTATFFDGCDIGKCRGDGSNNKDRDKLLIKSYTLASDMGGLSALSDRHLGHTQLFPVKSLANIDINPVEGSLVGPRVEVAVRDFEIATIVFDYYKIEQGRLIPIDYLGGYAIGMERLAVAKMHNSGQGYSLFNYHLYNTGLIEEACSLLDKYTPKDGRFYSPVHAPLFRGLVYQLLSSTETLIHLSRADYNAIVDSKNRRTLVNELKDTVRSAAQEIGFQNNDLRGFVKSFTKLIRDNLPKPFNEVDEKFALDVIGDE